MLAQSSIDRTNDLRAARCAHTSPGRYGLIGLLAAVALVAAWRTRRRRRGRRIAAAEARLEPTPVVY
jgi:MYXO-CTERM domain-containing protein